MKDDSITHQTGASAVSLAKSDPPTIGSSDHFDSVAQKRLPLGAEFYLAEEQRLAHIGSWGFNAAGFDYWSPELFRIHGLDPGGKAPTVEEYLALVHPEDREFVEQQIHEMLANHRAFDFTKRIVRPDGEIRYVRCVGTAATHGGTFGGFSAQGSTLPSTSN